MTEHPPFAHAELHMGMNKKEAGELLMLLNRSVNTMLPHEWPTWLDGFLKRLEQFTGAPVTPRPSIIDRAIKTLDAGGMG